MNYKVAAALLALAVPLGSAQAATLKDVDLMFVVDRSGSMGNEFTTLADNIGIVYSELASSGVVGSVGAGLIAYEGGSSVADSELLVQEITTDAGVFQTSTSDFINDVGVRGGTENALIAVDSAIPGGNAFINSGWRQDTVRSIVLITDEDADDRFSYSYDGLTGYPALGQYLDDTGYLNNIITSQSLFDDFELVQRPAGTADDPYRALFDINDFTGFNADPAQFFRDFANLKAQEISVTDPITDSDNDGIPDDGSLGGGGVAPIPVPAALPMLLGGLGLLGAWGRRRS